MTCPWVGSGKVSKVQSVPEKRVGPACVFLSVPVMRGAREEVEDEAADLEVAVDVVVALRDAVSVVAETSEGFVEVVEDRV